MSIDFKKLNNAYVLDNGNGNLMAYRINLQTRVVEPIVDKFGEPAGYAMTPKGTMMLGKALVGTDYTTYSSCAMIHTNFKAVPTEENRGIMVKYLSGWLKKMKGNCPGIESDGDNAVWLIGCPTGWKSKKIREDYRKIFEEAGYANPIIVWESNAALAHFQAANPRYATLAKDGIVLCIDLGAYSNDATLIINGEIKSVGGFVGASIIEKMLVAVNIREQERYRKSKSMLNPAELNVAVGQRFEMDSVFRSFMLLQGRWLKEQYFNRKKEGTLGAKGLTAQVGLDPYPDFEEEEYLNLYTNTEMMNDILYNRPVRNVLGEKMFGELNEEVRKEIGNFTWNQCLENFLRRVAAELPEFGDYATEKKQGKKPVVILTGGASQMDFVPVSVENVYSNIHLDADLTPVLSIALGLADFAPDKINAMKVEQVFDQILEEKETDEDGDEISCLLKMLMKEYRTMIVSTEVLVLATYKGEMLEGINGWADYRYKSDQIESVVAKSFEEKFNKEIIPSMEEFAEDATNNISDYLNSRYTLHLADTDLQNKTLFAKNELKLEFMSTAIKEILSELRDRSLETFQVYGEMFAEFPNPGRLNILSSRGSFLSTNGEVIIENINFGLQALDETMDELFFSEDMIEVYLLEFLLGVQTAVEKKKQEILGELIVEESDEEDEEA